MARIQSFPGGQPSVGYAFGVIQPTGGSTPVADTFADTLTLTSTDGSVSIIGNSSSDTLNFSAVTVGNVPVGAVIAWMKSFPNTPSLPSGFVECNGQTLIDASSVYNGATLPNLNPAGRMLLGDTTSGSVGGTYGTHTHTLSVAGTVSGTAAVDFSSASISGTCSVDGSGFSGSPSLSSFVGDSPSTTTVDNVGGGSTVSVLQSISFSPYITGSVSISGTGSGTISGTGSGTQSAPLTGSLGGLTDATLTIPPFMSVVWIMRVK